MLNLRRVLRLWFTSALAFFPPWGGYDIDSKPIVVCQRRFEGSPFLWVLKQINKDNHLFGDPFKKGRTHFNDVTGVSGDGRFKQPAWAGSQGIHLGPGNQVEQDKMV